MPHQPTCHQSPREWLFLFSICLLALFLRLYNLPQRAVWVGDTARDYLVAYHITAYGDAPIVGPTASGLGEIGGAFYYPPLYYYLLSLVLLLNKSPLFFIGFIACIQSLSVIFIYFIGKCIRDKRTGVVAAVFYAVSTTTVTFAGTVHGAVVSIPFFLCFLFLYILSIKKKNTILAFDSFVFLIISASISYVQLVLLPYFFIHFLLAFREKWWKKVLVCSLSGALLLIVFFPLIRFFTWEVFVREMVPSHHIVEFSSLGPSLLNVISVFFQELTKSYNETIPELLVLVLSMVVLVRATGEKNYQGSFFLWVCLLWFIIIGSLYKGVFYSHWTYSMVSILVILFAELISVLLTAKRCFKVAGLVAFLVLGYILSRRFYYLSWKQEQFRYDYYKTIAEKLLSDFGYTEKLHVVVYNEDASTWESGKVWYYFLNNNKKLFKIVNGSYYNIAPISDTPFFIVVVCKKGLDPDVCHQTLEINYPGIAIDQTFNIEGNQVYYLRNQTNSAE